MAGLGWQEISLRLLFLSCVTHVTLQNETGFSHFSLFLPLRKSPISSTSVPCPLPSPSCPADMYLIRCIIYFQKCFFRGDAGLIFASLIYFSFIHSFICTLILQNHKCIFICQCFIFIIKLAQARSPSLKQSGKLRNGLHFAK